MRNQSERDKDYVASILDHCDRITAAIERFGNSFDNFATDADYRDVIKMHLFQIGEISNKISDEYKDRMTDIPWVQMYGIRNIIAHAYVKVDEEIIWNTVINDIPSLVQILEKEIDKNG